MILAKIVRGKSHSSQTSLRLPNQFPTLPGDDRTLGRKSHHGRPTDVGDIVVDQVRLSEPTPNPYTSKL